MPLLDDLKVEVSQQELSRRRFLGGVVGGAITVAAAGASVTTVEFLSPNVLFEVETRFRVGRPEELTPGQVLFLPAQKVYLVRDGNECYAMSAVCTHLGCMTGWEAQENRIFCPCHGSRFSRQGKVIGGPAPKPLPRLALILERGFLVVDTKTVVADDFVLRV